jgi:hypothetical protein
VLEEALAALGHHGLADGRITKPTMRWRRRAEMPAATRASSACVICTPDKDLAQSSAARASFKWIAAHASSATKRA